MDSGTTQHMTAHRKWFSTYELFKHPIPIKLGDNNIIYAQGKGNIGIHLHGNVDEPSGTFVDVLYAPDISKNLFLIGRMMARGDKGVDIHLNGVSVISLKNNRMLMHASKRGNLYI